MSALNSSKWLPSESRVNTESYTWRLCKSDLISFTEYEDEEKNAKRLISVDDNYVDNEDTYGIMVLQSSEFTLSLVNSNGELKKVSLHLWLTRGMRFRKDYNDPEPDVYQEYLDKWVKLTLSDSDKPPTHVQPSHESNEDFRNTCVVWVVGKESKERRAKLTGGVVVADDSATKCLFYERKFVRYNDLIDESKGLLCDGQLKIVCEVHAVTDVSIFVNSWLSEFVPFEVDGGINEHTLASDLKQLREKGETSDFTVVTKDGREFPVHTFVLATRSPVFDAMFKQDMKEKRERRVVIDDIAPGAVARLLDFIYTDVVPGMNATLASELLPAAHKYQLPRLMTLCEEAMVPALSIENAAEFLQLADIYDKKQLLTTAKHFIADNLKRVMATDGWKDLKSHRAHLAYDLLEVISEHMTMIPM